MAYRSTYLDKQIGNYRISSELASGSFGTVFLAHHLYLKQRVAVIKILHAVRLGSVEEKEQFLQEAQILEMLKGLPFILPLLDVGIDDATPYLITEYAEQGSLRQRMRQRHPATFSTEETLTILSQVGQGLQAAHDRNVVHRDLKPENILFNAKGEALLADFGISTVLSTASIKYTDIVGTPAYMAPEQFHGEVSKESDQYALACIAYELLTGLQPFKAKDFVAMGFLHTAEHPVPPREHNQQIPLNVDQAILKALSKQRHDRFASISEFLHALEQSQAAAHAPTVYGLKPAPQARRARNAAPPQTPIDGGSLQRPGVPPTMAAPPYAFTPAGQAQQQLYAPGPMAAPAPYYGYAGWGNDPFLSINFGMKLLAALCYILPLLAWIVALVEGRKNRFVRFHWMQAMLCWLLWFICDLMTNTHTVAHGTTSPLFSIISLILFLLAIRLVFGALGGRYTRIWVLGTLAEKFAARRPR